MPLTEQVTHTFNNHYIEHIRFSSFSHKMQSSRDGQGIYSSFSTK